MLFARRESSNQTWGGGGEGYTIRLKFNNFFESLLHFIVKISLHFNGICDHCILMV